MPLTGSIWDRALFPRAHVVSSERSYFPNTSLGPTPYFSGSHGLSTPQLWRVHAKVLPNWGANHDCGSERVTQVSGRA